MFAVFCVNDQHLGMVHRNSKHHAACTTDDAFSLVRAVNPAPQKGRTTQVSSWFLSPRLRVNQSFTKDELFCLHPHSTLSPESKLNHLSYSQCLSFCLLSILAQQKRFYPFNSLACGPTPLFGIVCERVRNGH